MKSRLSSQQGVALIAALAFLVITMALIGTAMLVSLSDVRLSTSNTRTIQAQFAAEAAIDETVLTLWHGITTDIRADKAAEPNYSNIAVDDYRERWKAMGIKPALDENDDDGVVLGQWGEVTTLNGTLNLEGGEDATYVVDVSRKDVDNDESELRLVATVTLPGGSQRKLEQVYSVTLPPFELDFALLSDVVNCTFCHSAFISIEAGYDSTVGDASNHDLVDITNKSDRLAAAAGTQRIRVAALSDFRISTGYSKLHTLVGGSLYTRGLQNIMHNGGCSGNRFGNKCGVYGPVYQKNDAGEYTQIIANHDYEQFRKNGTTTPTTQDQLLTCTTSDNDGNAGCDQENARFYANYPSEHDGQPLPVDGSIPNVQSFPSPIRDLDGDRLIDNTEWLTAVKNDINIGEIVDAATFLQARMMPNPAIPGQMIRNYGGGNTLTINTPAGFGNDITGTGQGTAADPPASMTIDGLYSTIAVNPDGDYQDNLILIGTDTAPIELHDTVYVDGDVVIQGFVDSGNDGLLIARGNIYIVGDVVYDCNGSASGGGCDYTQPKTLPRFAMVAGGIMLIGDPVEINSGSMPLQGEILTFNDRQRDKFVNDLIDYPRYYVFREGDADTVGVWRCNATECRDWVTHVGGGKTQITSNIDALFSVSPTDNWLAPASAYATTAPGQATRQNINSDWPAIRSQDALRALWWQFGLTNNRDDASGNRRALRIDGLLYTNGAILGYLRSTDSMHGSLTINGSIVAYETGLLIYGLGRQHSTCAYNQSDTTNSLFERNMPECVGLRVQYDARLPSLIDLREDEPALFRTSYQWLSIEETP